MGKITIKIQFLSNDEVEVSVERHNKDIKEASNNLKLRPSENGLGRPQIDFPDNWEEIYNEWRDNKITATKAMEILGLKRNTFYRLASKWEIKESQEAEEVEESEIIETGE